MRILVLLSLGLLSFAFFCYANASHVIEPEPETEAEYPTDYELEEEIEELIGDYDVTTTETDHQPRTFGLLFLLSSLMSQLQNRQQQQQPQQQQQQPQQQNNV